MLGRWKKELKGYGGKAFIGQGNCRDEEMVALKRELNRVKKERGFLKEAAANSRAYKTGFVFGGVRLGPSMLIKEKSQKKSTKD